MFRQCNSCCGRKPGVQRAVTVCPSRNIRYHRSRIKGEAGTGFPTTPLYVMKILLTGASGLVGTELTACLKRIEHGPLALRRLAENSGEPWTWNPEAGWIRWNEDQVVDAVVHLAGENIAGHRWNPAVKQQIRESRTRGTRLLAEKLASLRNKPRVLISASATGIYGDQANRWVDERGPLGADWLSGVARDWEAATQPVAEAGIRVAHLRFGMILSPRGGALKALWRPFRLGLGGRVGSGHQYWSWIDVDDVIRIIVRVLENDSFKGPINVVSPQPVTNREFTHTLARVLWRPALLPLPAWGARLALGEMAGSLLLASTRVKPAVLMNSGFTFRYPTLEQSLRHLLLRP